MKYQIDITGMHCKSCEALIKMALKENNFEAIQVELPSTKATFESAKDIEDIKTSLNKAFNELKTYQYYNLINLGK